MSLTNWKYWSSWSSLTIVAYNIGLIWSKSDVTGDLFPCFERAGHMLVLPFHIWHTGQGHGWLPFGVKGQTFYISPAVEKFYYAPSQYQFGIDVTSASFAFNWSRGREATLTRAAWRYACCVHTEQALILSDITTKLLVTWIIHGLFRKNNNTHNVFDSEKGGRQLKMVTNSKSHTVSQTTCTSTNGIMIPSRRQHTMWGS